ncbi:MAG: response regulator [Bacteriovoracaceae bacterium]|nr:response regulator [Bacteriovoracaceae bacterium]
MKFLFVDDQEDIRELFSHYLENKFDASIINAQSAPHGIEQLESNTDVSVIICDYHMPDGNGGKLYSHVRNNFPHIPFVLFSSNISAIKHDMNFQNFFLNNQLNCSISKPCSGEDLVFMLKNIISQIKYKKINPDFPTKRKHNRSNMMIDAKLHHDGNGTTYLEKVINISQKGMFIQTKNHLPSIGENIKFRFMNNLITPHSGKGTVVWARTCEKNIQTGVGIKFDTEVNFY